MKKLLASCDLVLVNLEIGPLVACGVYFGFLFSFGRAMVPFVFLLVLQLVWGTFAASKNLGLWVSL